MRKSDFAGNPIVREKPPHVPYITDTCSLVLTYVKIMSFNAIYTYQVGIIAVSTV